MFLGLDSTLSSQSNASTQERLSDDPLDFVTGMLLLLLLSLPLSLLDSSVESICKDTASDSPDTSSISLNTIPPVDSSLITLVIFESPKLLAHCISNKILHFQSLNLIVQIPGKD